MFRMVEVANKEESIEMYRQQIDQDELSSGQVTPRIFINETCALTNNVPGYTGSTALLLTPPNHRKGVYEYLYCHCKVFC